ncbi:Uracil-DNA glycosylase [sediment metagenome]|uniref:Uracil-DNA glycosylase n=1 Tax=sediment metagenome TaxID=749907 RepID=D9PM98_9ZZZZ
MPSIKNIYKEMENDLNIKKDFTNGNLEYLTNQGVLLINQVLTVESHKPGSHWKQGWEKFSANVIEKISSDEENIVFIL